MISEIERSEIAKCVEVIKESFKTVAEEFNITKENAPRYTAHATTVERLLWQIENEKRLMYAYYDEGTIIGYYSLLMQENNECELNNLCVIPKYRNKGIGKELLMDSFVRAKEAKCNKINIGIVEENKKLRRWYEQNGFLHTGTKKFDFFPFTCGYMVKEI